MLREKSLLRASSSVQEIAAQTDPFEVEPSPAVAGKAHNHHLKYLNIEKSKLLNSNGTWMQRDKCCATSGRPLPDPPALDRTKCPSGTFCHLISMSQPILSCLVFLFIPSPCQFLILLFVKFKDVRTRKSPKKITSGLNGGLPARRPTEIVATFLNNKTANSPSLSLAPNGPGSTGLNYQTITKATSNSVKINSSTRSNTPSRPSVYSVVNENGSAAPKPDTTRLPTPRTSRSSLGNGYLSAASTAKSKSPNQINRSYLQQQAMNNGGHGQSTTSLNKPPPAPSNVNGLSVPTSGVRTGRPLMAYGGQRSATTSIISQPNNNNNNSNGQQTSWQLNKLQKQQQQQQQQLQQQQQQQLLHQQQQFLQQQQILMQKQRMAVNATMTHTTTSHSLASSASINNMSNSPRSPTSSISASSSINQMAPLNASSPRSRNESRNHSPSSTYSSNSSQQQPNKLMNTIISPSGLLTNGPLGRRTITSPSRMRERSSSPSNVQQPQNGGVSSTTTNYHHQHLTQQLINQLSYGSNGNLPSAPDSAKNPSSPTSARKQIPTRRSFLPQPVQYQSQHQINPSVSPIR